MSASRPVIALARFSVVAVLAVIVPTAATADGITEEEFRKILAADIEWVGKWSARDSIETGSYELLLSNTLSTGSTWWDGSINYPFNIRIGAGTLSYEIPNLNRTYRLKYVPDGNSYKLVGTLTGDTSDGAGTFATDIVLRPKK